MSAILKNCTCIDKRALDIIDFWFGGNQQINYRTKWFPEGSSEQQAAIDLEIFTKYGSLLESALRRELMSWQNYRTSCIALIVLLDQFSRHIYRHLGEPSPSPKRQETDSLALEVAKFLHSSPSEVVLDLPMAEYVFSLMPLRHNQTIDHLQFILAKLTEKEDSSVKANELLERFRKQTTRRLQHLQDRQRLEATDDILERHPFQADETNVLKERIVSTTEAFLKRNLPTAPYTSSLSAEVAHDSTLKKIIKNIVLISLSGGVDSMVICKILALLRDSKKVAIDEIVAIHIDYANRPESGREAAYVQQYSESLNVHCRVRVVNEVTRGITDRDIYEKVSRNIRYTFYQDCIQAALRGDFDSSKKNGDSATSEVEYRVSGILFGHHLGDVQENVISNVMRGCSPLDLSGMTETSITNNVHVWRPLLSHVKDDIYSFAHQYGVPYFKDSTPSWSTRGKLRNQLVPLLVEIYGEGCLRNLSNLAMESDNTQELVYTNLYKPFFDSVRRSQCGLMVNILPYRHQPLCFWKEVLKQLMHSMSMSMIRDKAVGNFVERLQRVTLQQLHKQQKSSAPQLLPAGWLELRKGYHTYLNEANDLIVLRDGTLRRNLVVYNPATTKNQMMQSSGSSQKDKDRKKKTAATAAEEKKVHETGLKTVPTTTAPIGSMKDTIVALACPDELLVLTNQVSGIPDTANASDPISAISNGVTSLTFNGTDEAIHHKLHYNETRFIALGKEDYEASNLVEEMEKEERTATPVRVSTSPTSTNVRSKILQFGPWKISITFNRIFATSSTAPLPRKTKLLKNVEDLLSERFSYKIYWPCQASGSPVQCDFIFLKDFLNLFEQFIVERRSVGGAAEYYSLAQHFYHEETTLFPDIINALSFDLKSMELRLRDGLPLLIPAFLQQTGKEEEGGGVKKFLTCYHRPVGCEEEGSKKESSDEYFMEFELSYEYINN